MAVEKMKLMNLVAHQEYMDQILRKIVLMENVHLIDAMTEIDESNFTLNMLEENLEEIMNMCMIKPYRTDKSFKKIQEELEELMVLMDIPREIKMEHFEGTYEYGDVEEEIDKIFMDFKEVNGNKRKLEEELEKLKRFQIIEGLADVDIDLKDVHTMKYFSMKLGTLKKENRTKFTMNYENVSAAAMHIGPFEDEEAYLIISPKSLETETNRILKSVYFTEVEILHKYLGPISEMIEHVRLRVDEIERHIYDLNEQIRESKALYAQPIACCYSRMAMEQSVTALKTKVACTNSFFYLSGWIGESDESFIQQSIEDIGYNIIMAFKELEDTAKRHVPPTKLKNSKLLKPFELLVEMYGTPSYTEVDPTVFLGLTYMFLFGAMFGDVGQGLVLYLAGLYMVRRNPENLYGGILSRLGMSSMVFGLLYDSIFGYEHVISHFVANVTGNEHAAEYFFLRPIENINTVLMSSIVIGLVLLYISFGYSIFNKLKIKDLKEGYFGRNGLAGLVLYTSLLGLVLGSFDSRFASYSGLFTPVAIFSVMVIIFREPLANYVKGHRPLHHESLSEYYVESGFDILETFLSMLSNSISFIRVGAFALNHVGLFIAFHTMASIIGTLAGDISMFIIGNLIVIFLEGLIVFIQGLRLVYYELFSKYYTGEGIPFEPANVRVDQ